MNSQVNHLSQWLMACKLLKEQRRRRREGKQGASDQTRLVIVSSFMHMGGEIDFNDLQCVKGQYSGYRGYCNSKLANVLTAKEMHRRISRYKQDPQNSIKETGHIVRNTMPLLIGALLRLSAQNRVKVL